MAPKQLLDKEAWEWAEKIDPHKIHRDHVTTAYRINLRPCEPGSCRRNCKGNPQCLIGLGEKEWLAEIADERWLEIDDPNLERRYENSFVGLKNLGATCYVNSLLQLWFHNPKFRKAIYMWKPEDDPQEKQNVFVNKNLDVMPVTCIGHLQLLFALLQYTSRRYIDPSEFIKSLGLDTSQQQDAQEFSKLFMNLLESKLQHQNNLFVRTIIHDQFRGRYAYVTKCTNCGNKSTCISTFYELDLNIKGHQELDDCIEEFLQEEKLDGANQYFCNVCESKQNATRRINLIQLPPVLNLQLLRFVFDRNSSAKKKLNSAISFPEILDMNKYLQAPGISASYNLSAVLIHHGSSAHSGHYIAHIKDRETGSWFKFNDEMIEKLEGKNLKLGFEEDGDISISAKKTKNKLKIGKGQIASDNAYMLVYTKQLDFLDEIDEIDEDDDLALSEKLQELVTKDNSQFEDWVSDMNNMRNKNIASGKARQSEIQQLYHLLPAKEGAAYEWIDTEWLRDWFKNQNDASSVDNSQLLCPHDKIHPDQVSSAKCISKEAADIILKKYGGGPRLNGDDSLCHDCVAAKCREIRLKARIREDSRKITALRKSKLPEYGKAYWIGKDSLRSWQRLVLEKHAVESNENSGGSDEMAFENGVDTASKHGGSDDDQMEVRNNKPCLLFGFNEEIVCIHNQLTSHENRRRLICEDGWLRLKSYFPSSPEFLSTVTVCESCQEMNAEDVLLRESFRAQAAEQKRTLNDLFLNRNRPILARGSDVKAYVINTEFLEEWRKFIREAGKRDPIHEVVNESLLCPHDGLMFQPMYSSEMNFPHELTLAWEWEWQAVCRLFNADRQITVACHGTTTAPTPATEPTTPDDGTCEKPAIATGRQQPTLDSQPSVCEECCMARLQQKKLDMLEYEHAQIFVRRVASNSSGHPKVPTVYVQNKENLENEDNDPEFQQTGAPRKRKKAENNVIPVYASQSGFRHTHRRRRTRSEKELNVSSRQSLRDLKLQIMNVFSVAPFDQHLSLSDGSELVDDQATLGSLQVLPGSLIFLKVDEPGEVSSEDLLVVGISEEGFKGTELLRS